MPTTEETAILDNEKTFEDYWPGLSTDAYLQDYVKIAEYLKYGSGRTLSALTELEGKLKAKCYEAARYQAPAVASAAISYFKAQASAFKDQDEKRIQQLKSSTLKFRKILTQVLEETEIAGGFNTLPGSRSVPTLIKFLTKQQFSDDLFKKELPFKDPGAKVEHGEFTHRIQWYLIIRGAPITHSPAKLFNRIAYYTPAFPNGYTTGSKEKRQKEFQYAVIGLWDALVDRLGPDDKVHKEGYDFTYKSTSDFRCPELFYNWLIESEQAQQTVPLLSAVLGARRAKRGMQRQIAKSTGDSVYTSLYQTLGSDFAFLKKPSEFTKFDLEYLANHLLRKKFSDLDAAGQKLVCQTYKDQFQLTV